MTQREEFEKWLNTLDKQTLVTMAVKQAKIIEEMQAAKSTSFNLPECMDYEFHGDKVINDPFANGYNQCLSDVIAMNKEYANSTVSDGWVPFSERHPDEDEKVIVFDTNDDYGHIYTLMFYSEFLDRKVGATVTHWMPLPAAPEQTK